MPPDRETPPPSALDWPGRTGTASLLLEELAERAEARRRRRTRVMGSLAAVILLAGGVGFLALRSGIGAGAAAVAVANRTPPPSTEQTLPDGSLVELKDGAQLTTDFSGAFRRVQLTRGTAHFQVVKNPARPFIVTAGGVSVRAVGTAFSVELQRGTVEVLVTEGRVAVGPSSVTIAIGAGAEAGGSGSTSETAKEITTIDAGAGVVLDVAAADAATSPLVRPVPTAEIEEKLSWRSRQLELSGTPLAEVVAMLNRHTAGGTRPRFTIADREIETVKLSGVIRTDKTAALVHLLEAECGVRAERREDGQIVLYKAK